MLTNYAKTYPFTSAILLAIVILSLYPFQEVQPLPDIPLADKWAHMVMYGGWCMVFWLEYLRQHVRIRFIDILVWGVLVPVLTGGLLECGQAFLTATRNGDWIDFVANSLGVGIGNLVGWIVLSPFMRKVLKYPKT